MMYLMLSVAGHLTIFQTRTRGPWWSIRPARILLLAVVGTLATLICVFGFLVAPLWWGWVALVWGYALAWFLVTDPVKLLAYRFLDSTKSKPRAKAASKSAVTTDSKPKAEAASGAKPKPDATAELKPESKVGPKLEVKADEADAEPKAAAKPDAEAKSRDEAGPEPISKAESKPEVESEPGSGANTDSASLLNTTLGDILLAGLVKDPEDAGRMIAAAISHADASTAAKPEGNAELKLEAAPKTKVKGQPDVKADPQPMAKTQPEPDSKAKVPSDSTPQTAK